MRNIKARIRLLLNLLLETLGFVDMNTVMLVFHFEPLEEDLRRGDSSLHVT